MKYLIGSIFLAVTLILLVACSFAIYKSIVDSLTWILVALPVFASTFVAWLVTVTAFKSAKDW